MKTKDYRFSSFMLVFLLLASCKKEANNEYPIIHLAEVEDSFKLSELLTIDSVAAIDLNGLLEFGEVKRAFPVNDGILLHTASPSTLSMIDGKGLLINQYQPDHLIENITEISIVGDKIYVLDRPSMQIHVFNFELGYEEYIAIPFFAQSFLVLSANRIVLFVGNEVTTNDGKLITFNPVSQEVIRDELDIAENTRKYFNFLTNYHFFENLGMTYFWESSSNIIYSVNSENEVEPAFVLDYGKKGVDSDFYENAKYTNPYEFVTDMRAKGISHRHFKILGNDSNVLIQFDFGDQWATSIYNLAMEKTISFNDIKDDLFSNGSMEAIELGFFTSLYGDASFVGFLPFEYLGEKNSDLIEDTSKNYLVFGRLK